MVNARLVLVTVVLIAPHLAAADRLKVAVVPGIAVNLDAGRVDALSQDLADGLAAELDIDAIGGLEVRRQLPPDGLPPDCVTTPACTADVAKRTGASQLLFVVMVDSGAGGSIQIDATWIEPSTGHTASRPAIDLTSKTDADVRARFQAAATQLLPDVPVRPKPQPQTGGNVSIDTSLTGGQPRHVTTPAMVTAGVAVVGLGTGVAFGLEARSKYNACSGDPVCANNSKDPQRDTIRHYALAADLGWVVAAGATIATLVLYATSSEAPHVVVTPTGEGVALTAVGRF